MTTGLRLVFAGDSPRLSGSSLRGIIGVKTSVSHNQVISRILWECCRVVRRDQFPAERHGGCAKGRALFATKMRIETGAATTGASPSRITVTRPYLPFLFPLLASTHDPQRPHRRSRPAPSRHPARQPAREDIFRARRLCALSRLAGRVLP